MITTEGTQRWHKYSDNEFVATVGQTASSVWRDSYWALLSFNHDTGSLSLPAWWTKAMHKPPCWRIVGLTGLLGLAVAVISFL